MHMRIIALNMEEQLPLENLNFWAVFHSSEATNELDI